MLRGKAFLVEMLSSEGEGYPWKYPPERSGTWQFGPKDYHKVTPHNKSHTVDYLGESQEGG